LACPPAWPQNQAVAVRELLGLSLPYYFKLAPGSLEEQYGKLPLDPAHTNMWMQLSDAQGFMATWGPRTAERRHPCYNYTANHECLWNAPSWPYETSRLLVGLSNLLNDYPPQNVIGKSEYFQLILQYARAHTKSVAINGSSPWIGEDLHPDDGYWIARQILYSWNDPLKNRGKDYNHSTFCDLVISGVVGLRPKKDSTLVINPLIPDPPPFDYFALDNVLYHGRNLTIFYDKSGARYGKGSGLHVLCNGNPLASSGSLTKITVTLC